MYRNRPRRAVSAVLALVLTLPLAFGPVAAFAAPAAPTGSPPHAAGRFLVKFSPGAAAAEVVALNARHGVRELDRIGALGVRIMSVPKGSSAEGLARAYSMNKHVVFAEPDYEVRASLVPNDMYYSLQWAMPKISAPAAWDSATGSPATTIAIVDTGVDSSHPDLAGRVVAGYDYVNDDPDPSDDHGHGTMCAGVIGANGNNSLGVAGTDWAARLLAVKVLDSSGSGWVSDVADGITYAADHGARIISMSLGSEVGASTLKSAVDYAYGKGSLLVAASGNEATSSVSYPAAYDNVMAVGATDSSDALASFSNFGTAQDVVAPGVSIATTYRGGSYTYFSGTSAATPFVAGLAGLLLAKNPSLTNASVRAAIRAGAVDLGATGWDQTYGWGRVDAAGAMAAVGATDAVTISSAGASPNPAAVGTSVTFTASATDSLSHALSYEWTEGTTVLSNSRTFSTALLTVGTHTVTVKASCTGGLSDTRSISVVVNPADEEPIRSLIGRKYGDTVSDAYLYSYRPTTNYSGLSTLAVGRSSYGEMRVVMRFPLAKLTGPDVRSAVLHLTRSGGATSIPLRAYRLARPGTVWPQVTWSQYAASLPWATPGAGAAGLDYRADVWCDSTSFGDFDVTALARAAAAAGETSLDLLIVDPAPVSGRSVSLYSSDFSIADSEPWLEVLSAPGAEM